MHIHILGVNGFIGHALARRILEETEWTLSGIDLTSDRLTPLLGHPRFEFRQGDIHRERPWIDQQIARSDIVFPLVAIAQPRRYVLEPIRVFELVFEENLRIVRMCLHHDTRVIFPSTSEVYGMCADETFNEETSPMVFGPTSKERWIYASAKQMLDRIIWAYRTEGLRFTIFRPFNWIGPNQDDTRNDEPGSSRVVTQFLGHLLRREPVPLVEGGQQSRSFTYISDGIDALMRIAENPDGAADNRIFNIGNPDNVCTIAELADHMGRIVSGYPGYEDLMTGLALQPVSAGVFYGPGYQDVSRRRPDIAALTAALGWRPRVGIQEALECTIGHYMKDRALARTEYTAGP
ncbi:bifunctional UDP-4-keto-pentose/UDP-xylose synthase [Roseibium sp. AS2]|uniref:bifunctional UDP-4-keto-pentose/UDP-xylose synthase n=1 Tax=Roseibium sp. AS2 TaxID=3135781 RepID=UPI0031714D39